jgi:hypothetical protein
MTRIREAEIKVPLRLWNGPIRASPDFRPKLASSFSLLEAKLRVSIYQVYPGPALYKFLLIFKRRGLSAASSFITFANLCHAVIFGRALP